MILGRTEVPDPGTPEFARLAQTWVSKGRMLAGLARALRSDHIAIVHDGLPASWNRKAKAGIQPYAAWMTAIKTAHGAVWEDA